MAALGLCLLLGFGCAAIPPVGLAYDYFVSPRDDDPWSRKIRRWQQRERSDTGEDALRAPAPVAEPGVAESASGDVLPTDLREKYNSFRAEQKRAQARDLAEWIQLQSREHYVPDGPIDRWATFAETLRQDGDDCDGLELLTFHLLRDLGFSEDAVFRAIVYRKRDGQHHMVTLWFEDAYDPWVLDPTGAMTSGMPRMSELPGWVPLKVFGVDENFSVERSRSVASN
ncbi:MAG: hypothetical protein CL938_13135 [Deltaproteobacteria bacterium]|nr:hypothetical protein [Deltaproteobacteria bacterium]